MMAIKFETNITHKSMSDEEVYQALKKTTDNVYMDADEWKELRLKVLKEENKEWTY